MKALKRTTSIVMVIVGFCLLSKISMSTNATSTTTQIVQNPRINQGATQDITVWDCIWFGKYWQSSDGADGYNYEPIKWRVLSVDGNNAFVVSDRGLDCKEYND